MARRDNQGIQIAMIVFILTTLLFMVTTYFGYSSSTRLSAQVESLQGQLQTANSGLSGSEQLVSSLKQYMGVSGADDSAIQAALKEAVEVTYGQGLPPENQNFQDISKLLTEKTQELYGQLAQARDTEQQLRQQVAEARATQQKLVAEAQAAQAQAVADANQQQQAFASQRATIDQQRRKALDEIDTTKAQMNALTAATDERVKRVETELRSKEGLLLRQSEELNSVRRDTPDQFDGHVVGVVAATREVWLDKGSADGVRPKTLFGVYDADDSNARAAKKKATIEVTRVLDAHRSLARITDSDFIQPVVRGDLLYSPIWSPGSKLGVALLGKMDIDKNGSDDRDYIRNLIELNGGQVDAEDAGGEIQGQLTVNTRYLVVGENTEDTNGQSTVRTPMMDTARQLGVEQMSVSELLDLMGYAGRARSLSYTGAQKPGDFAPEQRDTVGGYATGKTQWRDRSVPLRRRNQASPSY